MDEKTVSAVCAGMSNKLETYEDNATGAYDRGEQELVMASSLIDLGAEQESAQSAVLSGTGADVSDMSTQS